MLIIMVDNLCPLLLHNCSIIKYGKYNTGEYWWRPDLWRIFFQETPQCNGIFCLADVHPQLRPITCKWKVVVKGLKDIIGEAF